METKRSIELSIIDRTWHAAMYLDGRPDPEILDLFGTHVLPTPYTDRAVPEQVFAAIRDRNPDATISMRS